MAQLTQHDAARLAWQFVRRGLGWWRRGRVENRPEVRLVTHEEFARLGLDRPDTWLVSFPRRAAHLDCDPDPSTLGVTVDDPSGACEWTARL